MLNVENEILELLKHYQIKKTKPRVAILKALYNAKTPCTIEEINHLAQPYVNMNLSTTYRSITLLCDVGIVIQSLTQDGKSYYQLHHPKHEHFLICKKCKQMIAIDDCPLHAIEQHLKETTGFEIYEHQLQFIGLCPKCKQLKQD